MSAERFSEPHYQRAAERYLQTALTVLAAVHPERPPSLSEVVDRDGAAAAGVVGATRTAAAGEPHGRLPGLDDARPAQRRRRAGDAAGAAQRVGRGPVSGTGRAATAYLEPPASCPARPSVDLGAALEGGDVVLFSLNSSTYGKLAAQLGALAIQDLTSAAGRRLERPGRGAPVPATIALDEFSALGADNVLSLLARGREAGRQRAAGHPGARGSRARGDRASVTRFSGSPR